MFRRGLFILAHQIGDARFYPTYKRLVKNQRRPYSELREEQDSQLRRMIGYVNNNVPYYHRIFRELDLKPDEIRGISDLERLPIITKDIIKQNWDEFKPLNLNKMRYYEQATGGSTGTPSKYRLDKFDRFIGGAMLYRGWGYAGYDLGDRMVFLAGSSLDVTAKSNLTVRCHEFARNIKKLSSFDMGERDMAGYVRIINDFKPKFIRGYASSIFFFAKWLDENNISIHQPLAVFTTAEKIYPNMRNKIGEVFGCDVFDNYGLNDGGVSAYECKEHSGLHIDTERSIMEVIDENGFSIEHGEGEIIATSLNNYSMPFLRYCTGDLGHIIENECECGSGFKLLKEVVGRSVDMLITPEGKSIHGWFFLFIFWKHSKGIREYQVTQKTIDRIVINIVPNDDFNEAILDEILGLVRSKSLGWDVEFKIVDKINRTISGKYKFIVNEVL